jgi:polysaccharide biosynthesis protein PslG
VRVVAAVAGVALGLLAASPGPAPASAAMVVPDGGVIVEGPTEERKRAIDMAHAAGLRWVSMSASWALLEPDPDSYLTPGGAGSAAWAELEEEFAYAKARGMSTELRLANSPTWASGRDASNDPPTPPNVGAYGAFLEDLARRLGPYIDAYTPWNEANLTTFWSPVDPVAYTALQKVAYRSLKAADPSAIVLSTNIVGGYDYLSAAYRAGLAGHADAIGWTSYPTNAPPEASPTDGNGRPARSSLAAQLYLRDLIDAFDPGRRVWIMEFGWSTCTPLCRPYPDKTVDEARQADYLVRSFEFRRRYLSHVTDRIFWYAFRDLGTSPSDWTQNHGLVRNDYSPKPAYAALRSLAVRVADGQAIPGSPGATAGGGLRVAVGLPPAAARLRLPAVAATRRSRVVLGRPTLRARRGVLTLSLRIVVRGGSTRVLVDGYRLRRWRPITSSRVNQSGRFTVRFPDRGEAGVRVRATLPGRKGWRIGRVVRAPRTAAASGWQGWR